MTELVILTPLAEVTGKLEEIKEEIKTTQEWNAELTDEVTAKLVTIFDGNEELRNQVIAKLEAIRAESGATDTLSTLATTALLSELKALRVDSNDARDKTIDRLEALIRGHELFNWGEEVPGDD